MNFRPSSKVRDHFLQIQKYIYSKGLCGLVPAPGLE